MYFFNMFGFKHSNKTLNILQDKINESNSQLDADFDIKNLIVEIKKTTFYKNK